MDRELAAAAIADFANTTDERRDQLRTTAPLPRPVDLLDRSWEPWLRDGGRPESTSYVGPLETCRIVAGTEARKGLTPRDPARRGADFEIDRAHLVALSERSTRSNERRCLALWIASMMWGSGTVNGRGPWRTAQALADDELGSMLVASHRCVRAGELWEAYEVASDIPGSGESFFTKWLWAASLGLPEVEVQPLILDARVRRSLGEIDVRPQHNASGYVDYVETMAAAASTLRSEHGLRGATPEKVEFLLSAASG